MVVEVGGDVDIFWCDLMARDFHRGENRIEGERKGSNAGPILLCHLSFLQNIDISKLHSLIHNNVALAEWLRRVPAKYMGFPRESSNLSGDVYFFHKY